MSSSNTFRGYDVDHKSSSPSLLSTRIPNHTTSSFSPTITSSSPSLNRRYNDNIDCPSSSISSASTLHQSPAVKEYSYLRTTNRDAKENKPNYPSLVSSSLINLWLARFAREEQLKEEEIHQFIASTDRSQFNDCFDYDEFKSLMLVLLESATPPQRQQQQDQHQEAKSIETSVASSIPAMAESKTVHSHIHSIMPAQCKSTYDGDDSTLSVTLIFPSQPANLWIVNVRYTWTWGRFLEECCRRAGILDCWHDMTLLKLESTGWNTKLNETQVHSENRIISSLDPDDSSKNVFELRRIFGANVGGKFRLSTIANSESHNRSIQDKVEQLSQLYDGFREIRGDGNCYYRAVIYGAMEMMLSSPRRSKHLQEWAKLFRSTLPPHVSTELFRRHNQLLMALSQASEGLKWPSLAFFEADMLDDSTELDDAFIRAAKYAVTSYILDNLQTTFNGLTLETAIMAFDESCRSIESYCNKAIIKMGECAEGAHVYLGILPYLLGVGCEIVMLYSDPSVPLAIQHCDGLMPHYLLGEVSLLFRPGHYDLLYKSKTPPSKISTDAAQSMSPISRSTSQSLLRSVSEKFSNNYTHSISKNADDNPTNNKHVKAEYEPMDVDEIGGLPVSAAHVNIPDIRSRDKKDPMLQEGPAHAQSQQVATTTETILNVHELQSINSLFYQQRNIDIYRFLVEELDFPSSSVLDAMTVYRISALSTLIKVIWMLKNQIDFNPGQYANSYCTLCEEGEIKYLVKTCKTMGIPLSDIVYAIAVDEAIDVNDVMDSIETKSTVVVPEEVLNEISADFEEMKSSKVRLYDASSFKPRYSEAELQKKVKAMNRKQLIDLLKKFKYYYQRYDGLSTRALREKVFYRMQLYRNFSL